MIAKGRSVTHLKASIAYVLKKEEAYVLDKNIVGENPKEVVEEFRHFQALNERCERNNLSFVISPSIEDGQQMNEEQLREVTQSFLEKMDLEDHQYIAFVHSDTKHKHVHLYVNRIDYEGHAYKDSYVSNRASGAAEEIAQEMDLKQAKEIQMEREQELEKDIKEEIKELAHQTLAKKEVNDVEGFIEQFNEAGAGQNMRAEAYHNKQGAFVGLRFYADEQHYKASEIDRSLGKKQLEQSLQEEPQQAQERVISLRI